jgi:Amt family ammonium transporter
MAPMTALERLGYSINFTWTLVAAFLVFSMQAGLHCLADSYKPKTCLVIWRTVSQMVPLVPLCFGYLVLPLCLEVPGAALVWNPVIYLSVQWFFLAGGSYDVQTIMLWLFQMVFCTKAVTIMQEL